MDLSQAQVGAFRRDGFLIIERASPPPEVAVLESALPEITDPSRAKVGFDDVSGMVVCRTARISYNEANPPAYLASTAGAAGATPARHRMQHLSVSADDQARHEWRRGGKWLGLHQDFSTWHRADGMPELAPLSPSRSSIM